MTLTGFGRTLDNNFGVSDFIVDGSGLSRGATHTTIASALTSASSGDTIFIRPGTYTENLTLKAGVNLCAFNTDCGIGYSGGEGIVIISGKATFSSAGTVGITGIELKTNSDFSLVVSGSAASTVNLINCNIYCSNNTGISLTSTGGAIINLFSCVGNLATTGIGFWSVSGTASVLNVNNCVLDNSGTSLTASTNSAGTVNINNCLIRAPLSNSGTAAILRVLNSDINPQGDAISVNIGSTVASDNNIISQCRLRSATMAANECVTIAASADCLVTESTLSTNATNAITGSGTLRYSGLAFPGTGHGISTSTVTARFFRPGVTLSPVQPAFNAVVNGTVANVTGDNTEYTVIFDTEVYDIGSNFNTGTGTFTAPYTGKYLLVAGVLTQQGTTAMTASYWFVTSNRNYTFGNYVALPANGNFPLTVHAIADMDASDTAQCHLNFAGGTKVVDVYGTSTSDNRTYFHGFLLG